MALTIIDGLVTPDFGGQEVVERKGLGHPDTLADGVAEMAAIDYSGYTRDRFGLTPHFNFDKVTLTGGLCVQQFAGVDSEFVLPIHLQFMGRGSTSYAGEEIPLTDIQYEAAAKYLARVMPNLDITDPEVFRMSSITSQKSTKPNWFTPESVADLPEYAGNFPKANDTATMISYWPLTPTERLTLALEGYFYEPDPESGLPKPRFSFIGQDVKVMSVRTGNNLKVAMAVPQLSQHTASFGQYVDRLFEFDEILGDYSREILGEALDIELKVNPEIDRKSPDPMRRPYMTRTGSCIDFGEEGAVGRGNKTHNVIASFRPNTMEAPHGKNPVYFVGKVLGFMADQIARSVHEETGARVQVTLRANQGDNLFDPSDAIVQTDTRVDRDVVEEIVATHMGKGRAVTDDINSSMHFLPTTIMPKM